MNLTAILEEFNTSMIKKESKEFEIKIDKDLVKDKSSVKVYCKKLEKEYKINPDDLFAL